ncbi:MAG: hypothetical protein QOH04_859 [Sphingomonadales bacterium]|jgi:hypothetical protein|nr:hypothetical protein [Sphingomonadales bacterium]
MADYSCYLTIANQTGHVLDIGLDPPQWGSWVDPPQQPVPRGGSVAFRLKDGWGAAGSEGSFAARPEATPARLRASFQDGYVQSNYCNVSGQNMSATMAWSFTGASGSPDNPQHGSVPGGGHPVYLVFTFTDSASPPPAKPPKAGASAASDGRARTA